MTEGETELRRCIDDDEPLETVEAFLPQSPHWGSMLCPVAKVEGRINLIETKGDRG